MKACIQRRTYRILLLVSMAGPAAFWIILIIAGLLKPAFDPVKQSLSDLALGPYGWLQRANLVLLGLIIACLGLALRVELGKGKRNNLILVIFGAMAVGQVISGFFQADNPTATSMSVHAIIHQVGASAPALGFPICAWLLWPVFKRHPEWQGMEIFDLVLGTVIFLLDAFREVLLPTHWLDPWFGLFERILILAIIIWAEAVAVRLWIISSPGHENSGNKVSK